MSRKTFRDGGAAATELLAEMDAVVASLTTDEPRLVDIGTNLARAIADVRAVLEWMLRAQSEDPRLPAAASVHYLKLWGVTCGGWLMARAAQICHAMSMAGEGDPVFCDTKITTAHFYAGQVMPQTSALMRIIVSGTGTVLALDAANF